MKAIRDGRVNLKDSYGKVEAGEVFLHNLHVSPYSHRGYAEHEPLRRRKLLLNKREIRKLIGKMVERGFTLVPVRMYFKRGLVKVTVGVAKGKKTYDKRETIKRRQVDRETPRPGEGRLAVRALVTGAGGQLGRTVAWALAAEHDVAPLTRADLDVTDESRVRAAVADLGPGVIVNCAAYNAVDDAEDDAAAALEVNAFGVRSLARAAAAICASRACSAAWMGRAPTDAGPGAASTASPARCSPGARSGRSWTRSCRRAMSTTSPRPRWRWSGRRRRTGCTTASGRVTPPGSRWRRRWRGSHARGLPAARRSDANGRAGPRENRPAARDTRARSNPRGRTRRITDARHGEERSRCPRRRQRPVDRELLRALCDGPVTAWLHCPVLHPGGLVQASPRVAPLGDLRS